MAYPPFYPRNRSGPRAPMTGAELKYIRSMQNQQFGTGAPAKPNFLTWRGVDGGAPVNRIPGGVPRSPRFPRGPLFNNFIWPTDGVRPQVAYQKGMGRKRAPPRRLKQFGKGTNAYSNVMSGLYGTSDYLLGQPSRMTPVAPKFRQVGGKRTSARRGAKRRSYKKC